METIEERMQLIERHVANAVAAVERDSAASKVLVAVVRELHKKQKKAFAVPHTGVDQALREALIEAEQAADSAKIASDADPSASRETKTAVEDAHLAFCMLKNDVLTSKLR